MISRRQLERQQSRQRQQPSNQLQPTSSRIWTPTNPNPEIPLTTTWFQPSNETMAEQELLLSNMYFLVVQGDAFGERLRCIECNRRHDYITLRCIPKPITGMANGLYAYYRALSDNYRPGELSPANKLRLEQIKEVIGQMPDLASVHPEMARKVVQDIGPSDLKMGAVALGVLEGISPTEAKSFEQKINDKGIRPPFKLSVVQQAEIDRALQYRGIRDRMTSTRRRW